MKNVKTFEIDSFERLVNVIDEKNFEHLTMDLILWLRYNIIFMKSIRKQFPKQCKGKTNWEICNTAFIYIADGKHDMKSVTVKNKLTGEIQTVQLKK